MSHTPHKVVHVRSRYRRSKTRRSLRKKVRKRTLRKRQSKINSVSGHRQSAAWQAGLRAMQSFPLQEHSDELTHLQQLWKDYYRNSSIPQGQYVSVMQAFVMGSYSMSGRQAPNAVLLPTEKTVAIVVVVMNEERSIDSIVRQLERLPLHELVFVVNGSTDASLSRIRSSRRAIVIHDSVALGHDVGRAVGARMTASDIVLFIDADIPIEAEQLISFVHKADSGMDVVLNNLFPYIGKFADRDEVSIVKEFLNRSAEREDLTINSLTAVPHALTRRAIQIIGTANLAIPPKAQAIALQAGLKVGIGGSIDVIKRNRLRHSNTGTGNPMARLIIGDHLEALGWAMKSQHPRLQYKDRVRARSQMEQKGE